MSKSVLVSVLALLGIGSAVAIASTPATDAASDVVIENDGEYNEYSEYGDEYSEYGEEYSDEYAN